MGLMLILLGSVSAINTTPTQPQSKGDILYVGGSGAGNYTRIQDAIDNSTSGDTIYVYDQSSPYYENIRINKSLELIGQNRATTIIDGHTIKETIYVRANNVTIRGFTIQNGSEQLILFDHHNREYGTITDNIINSSSKYTMDLWLGKYITVTNNIIKSINRPYIGIDLSTDNCYIANNEIYGYGRGIDLSSRNSIITNNIFHHNSRGIYLSYFNGGIFDSNILYNNSYGIEGDDTKNCRFSNNTFSNNKIGVHIEFPYCYNMVFENNLIENSKIGFEFEEWFSHGIVENNIIRNCSNSGFFLGNLCQSVQILNNIIENCPVGINQTFASYTTIKGNVFKSIKLPIFFLFGNNNTVHNNYWNRPRILPKPVFCIKFTEFTYVPVPYPGFIYDIRPKLLPIIRN